MTPEELEPKEGILRRNMRKLIGASDGGVLLPHGHLSAGLHLWCEEAAVSRWTEARSLELPRVVCQWAPPRGRPLMFRPAHVRSVERRGFAVSAEESQRNPGIPRRRMLK